MNKNKKGVSVIISYVLLVIFAVIIGGIVFQWLKTYTPFQSLECPEGVSIMVENVVFFTNTHKLSLNITNNGRFNLSGYLIKIKNNQNQEIPVIDISQYLNEEESSSIKYRDSILLFPPINFDNKFRPGDEKTNYFDLPEGMGTPILIKVTPIRFQEYNKKQKMVVCGDASLIKEVLAVRSGAGPRDLSQERLE
ncbi:MAG: hypothetical protein QXU40_01785 [Candidatus Pacearchaeota archaeon]